MKSILLRTLFILAVVSTDAVAQVAKQIRTLPAVISKPGRYILSKDLVLTKVADAAITINADDVKLDLGGRVITHTLTNGADVTGIVASSRGGISVFNGTVRGFTTGIRLNGFQAAASGVSVENVRVESCKLQGIQLLGLIGTVKHCVVASTGTQGTGSASGIVLDLGFATVVDNDVIGTVALMGNPSYGIFGNAQAAVIENNRVLNDPNGHGDIGMRLGFSSNYIVENNRIAGFTKGIEFTAAGRPKYRNNITTDCATPYVLGTDAGNND